ncbi:hypothetical protein [Streptomyces brasiliensis]|uniref:Integral membrane protein n=1 Tax=Streptomyces brasiliensis TaxID=1954 RepID=A0A917NM35_9ACTN|nr:hypothetical protein [Streptomyces brasiliensis]GGJ10397.1 hypothetical protein GCM10010121_020920 [Streptomyces brasiliensis]
MTGLGELDPPGTPGSTGAWDTRSEEWLAGDGDADLADETESPRDPGVPAEADAAARTSPAADPEDGKDRRPAARRGAADPVKSLMHRHRELCERAVDPLEIAAGLEAHGVTDRTAARFRHRDVFSLAEEMYARVPRDAEPRPRPTPAAAPRARADWALLALLPGVLCAATVAGLHLTHGRTRFFVAAGGVLAVSIGVRAAFRRGPLAVPPGTHAWRSTAHTRAWTWWLLAYALLGDGLLGAVLAGGPDDLPNGTTDGPWPLTAAPVLALTLACAPAAWSAHLFAAYARRRLAASRGLEEFSAAVQPLLLGTFALFLCALAALAALSGTALDEPALYPETLALGALLLLARLLTVHHQPHTAFLALAAAAGAEALAPGLVLIGHLPGCSFLAVAVQTLVDHWGAGGVPTLACAAAALTLLWHATRALSRASAHAPTGEQT